MFQKVAIVGPGLIGGSLGMALRQRGRAETVVGVGRRESSLREALEVGAIDQSTLDVREGAEGADLLVLATPPGAFGQIVEEALPALAPETIVTDVASTKVQVIEVVSAALRERPDVSYIPTHPMAGSEKRGALAARADLFEGSVCIITPLTNTFPQTKTTIRRMWESVGARTTSMTPQTHDRVVARISHVPHLAAAALIGLIDHEEGQLAGGGLRDTTRIASADPDLWVEICKSNRRQVRDALADYIRILQQVAGRLEAGDFGGLRAMLSEAKQKRDSIIAQSTGSED